MDARKENVLESLENARSLWLVISVFLSGCLLCQIWIVTAALAEDWTGMGFAIALTVTGFLAAPFSWMHFARLCGFARLARLIVGEKISLISELAARLRLSPRRTLWRAKALLNTRFLPGYVLFQQSEVIPKARADERKKSEGRFDG